MTDFSRLAIAGQAVTPDDGDLVGVDSGAPLVMAEIR